MMAIARGKLWDTNRDGEPCDPKNKLRPGLRFPADGENRTRLG
jgi:hypothetical protein